VISQPSSRDSTIEITNHTLRNKFCVINVYNEVGPSTVSNPGETIGKLDLYNKLLVLSDFNLYHLLWSTTHHHANHGDLPLNFCSLLSKTSTSSYSQYQRLKRTGGMTESQKSTDPCLKGGSVSRDLRANHLPITVAVHWNWQPITPKKRLRAKINVPILQ
jgi:hypothetical protein